MARPAEKLRPAPANVIDLDIQPSCKELMMKRLGKGTRKGSIEKLVGEALRLLFTNDGFLLETNVAERTIATQLITYLKPRFPDYDVDPEYNRHGLETKVVRLPTYCRGGGQRRIFPDVVVHRRGCDEKNLLVIQIKKVTNPESRNCDRAIIKAMKRKFGYGRGLLIDLPAGPGAKGREPKLEWL
jgi:hypothetical protein